ncbi:hypothetical protein Tco_0914616, partial [Tanacetum coccineum]
MHLYLARNFEGKKPRCNFINQCPPSSEQILIRNFEGIEARCIIHCRGCEQMAII